MSTTRHTPEPLTILDRDGAICRAATQGSYPLTAACTCGRGAITCADGSADWHHPADTDDYDPEEDVEYCSICDGIGHGYPGGRPCPLEERGTDDGFDDWERSQGIY